MVSILFSAPKIRAFDHQRNTNLMLSSNCLHSLPQRPQITASGPRFRASKLTDKSSFAPAPSYRVSETHRRFSTKVNNYCELVENCAGISWLSVFGGLIYCCREIGNLEVDFARIRFICLCARFYVERIVWTSSCEKLVKWWVVNYDVCSSLNVSELMLHVETETRYLFTVVA